MSENFDLSFTNPGIYTVITDFMSDNSFMQNKIKDIEDNKIKLGDDYLYKLFDIRFSDMKEQERYKNAKKNLEMYGIK